MKPLIAVMPLWDDEKESIWMIPGYMNGIECAGGIPIILPLHSSKDDALNVLSLCDGLLMTGGQDVSPALYGEDIKSTCGRPCTARDSLEEALYSEALKTDMPVLGICRGIQLINVLHGGTLYQDLQTEYECSVDHHMKPPYTDVCHGVDIVESSPLHKLLKTEHMGVNSYHHQAVKDLGKNLSVMAVSDDGLVEAVCCTEKDFVWAVQWHPELNFQCDENSRKIFEAFVNECRKKKRL